MQTPRLSAVAVLCLVGALFAASCVQSSGAPDEPESDQGSKGIEATGEAREPLPIVGGFGSDYFPFVTIVEDDGADDAGGWQEADADLPFAALLPPRTWHCYLTVGMPLRTQRLGRISPSRAAMLSGQIATATGRSLSYRLPAGTFCKELKDGMKVLFAAQEGLGARVTTR